jgi:hypothetical protein
MVNSPAQRMDQELQDFITDGSRRITPAHLDKLVRLLPNIRLAVTQITEFPDLSDQVGFLAEIIEDFHAGLNRSIPFTAIAESQTAVFEAYPRPDRPQTDRARPGFRG